MGRRKVVIVGGGFGGLNVALGLRRSSYEVVLIDKKNHHLFQPLLYQVASATLSPADIATPLRKIFRRHAHTTVIMGTVERVDKHKRVVILANGEEIGYDLLVISPGAKHDYFGQPQWEHIAPGLKTIEDALKIRERVMLSFEEAERIGNQDQAQAHLNFVIVGGGPTGVEMAGALAEIARKTLWRNFRRIRPELSKIYLIEGTSRVLPPYPTVLGDQARVTLEKMGVTVLTDSFVTQVTEDGVYMDEIFIPTKNVIWAAGNRASPLLETLEVSLDRQGRVQVEPDLSLRGHSEIFVIGDAACVFDQAGNPLPGVAPVAIQQAAYLVKLFKNERRSPQKRIPFHYFDKGSIATIGKNKAVGFMRSIHLSGIFAYLIWGFVHIFYLVSFRSRVVVVFDWIFHYLTNLRGARLIHQSIDERSLARRCRSNKKI